MLTNTEITSDIIQAMQDKKGKKIVIIDLSELETAPTHKFIICEGKSTSQVAAIADSIRDRLLEDKKIKPYNYTGYQNAQWIVLDYGDTFVHIFHPESRNFYNIEELWSDAPTELIPDID